jgi:hypothetical protein
MGGLDTSLRYHCWFQAGTTECDCVESSQACEGVCKTTSCEDSGLIAVDCSITVDQSTLAVWRTALALN